MSKKQDILIAENNRYMILILILFNLFNLSCFAQNMELRIDKIETYEENIWLDIEEIKALFYENKILYDESIENDFIDQAIEFTIIQPKEQNIYEKIKLDFWITFYKDSINNLCKYNVNPEDLNKLFRQLVGYTKIIRSLSTTEYRSKNIIIKIYKYDTDKIKNQIVFENILVSQIIWEKKAITFNHILCCINNSECNLFTEPSSRSLILRKLDILEKINYIDFNPAIKINDEGKWIQIETIYGETGWVLESNLRKLTIQEIQKVIYYPLVTSLRMRETPSTEGKIIRNLNIGEKLIPLEYGKVETINGIKGRWVRVKTEEESGWCFDGYLDKLIDISDLKLN